MLVCSLPVPPLPLPSTTSAQTTKISSSFLPVHRRHQEDFLHIPLQHAPAIRRCSCPPQDFHSVQTAPKAASLNRTDRCNALVRARPHASLQLGDGPHWVTEQEHGNGAARDTSHAETGPAGRHIVAAAYCQGLSPDVQPSMASALPQITPLGMLRHVRKDGNRGTYWGQREPIAKS